MCHFVKGGRGEEKGPGRERMAGENPDHQKIKKKVTGLVKPPLRLPP